MSNNAQNVKSNNKAGSNKPMNNKGMNNKGESSKKKKTTKISSKAYREYITFFGMLASYLLKLSHNIA